MKERTKEQSADWTVSGTKFLMYFIENLMFGKMVGMVSCIRHTIAGRKIVGKQNKTKKKDREKKKYVENVLKNVKGRNGLHTCTLHIHTTTHIILSQKTLLFLLPLLIFIAFCRFVFVSLSLFLAMRAYV